MRSPRSEVVDEGTDLVVERVDVGCGAVRSWAQVPSKNKALRAARRRMAEGAKHSAVVPNERFLLKEPTRVLEW